MRIFEYSPAGIAENLFRNLATCLPVGGWSRSNVTGWGSTTVTNPDMPDFPSSADALTASGSPFWSGNSGPDTGMKAIFVTVTQTLSKVVVAGIDVPVGLDVEAAKVVPAGKLGAEARDTPTAVLPEAPPEGFELVPPPPQAARVTESASRASRQETFRNVATAVFIFSPPLRQVSDYGASPGDSGAFPQFPDPNTRNDYRKNILPARRTPPLSLPWTCNLTLGWMSAAVLPFVNEVASSTRTCLPSSSKERR